MLLLVRRFSIPPLLFVWELHQCKHTVIKEHSKYGEITVAVPQYRKSRIQSFFFREMKRQELIGVTHCGSVYQPERKRELDM